MLSSFERGFVVYSEISENFELPRVVHGTRTNRAGEPRVEFVHGNVSNDFHSARGRNKGRGDRVTANVAPGAKLMNRRGLFRFFDSRSNPRYRIFFFINVFVSNSLHLSSKTTTLFVTLIFFVFNSRALNYGSPGPRELLFLVDLVAQSSSEPRSDAPTRRCVGRGDAYFGCVRSDFVRNKRRADAGRRTTRRWPSKIH